MFEKLKNAPHWVWWAGGGIVGIGLLFAYLHNKSAAASNTPSGSPSPTTSTVTGGQGGVPSSSSGGGSGNTSVYSPTTTTTTTYADTYTNTNAPTTTFSAGGNIELPGTAAGGCPPGMNCSTQPAPSTATMSLSQVESELQALGSAYNNTQNMGQRTALHAQAQSIRQLAAAEGLGTLVPTQYGYLGLQTSSGQVY